MNQELINHAMALFDTPEKWNAFLELVWQKDNIRNQWYLKLKEELDKHFCSKDLVEGWEFKLGRKPSEFVFQWFLKEHGGRSISLWLENEYFSLFVSPDYCKVEEVQELIRTEKFAPIFQSFDRVDEENHLGGYIIRERGNFSFDTSFDSRFNFEKLAWFAGNKTEDFLNQIVAKVNRIRKDEHLNALLNELNIKTKKG